MHLSRPLSRVFSHERPVGTALARCTQRRGLLRQGRPALVEESDTLRKKVGPLPQTLVATKRSLGERERFSRVWEGKAAPLQETPVVIDKSSVTGNPYVIPAFVRIALSFARETLCMPRMIRPGFAGRISADLALRELRPPSEYGGNGVRGARRGRTRGSGIIRTAASRDPGMRRDSVSDRDCGISRFAWTPYLIRLFFNRENSRESARTTSPTRRFRAEYPHSPTILYFSRESPHPRTIT